MISFEKFELENGLRVVVHEDRSTPMVALNILYDVGGRDETPTLTGFAHLFEHLMFSGSQNIQDFDTPLQMAGGESNAFTNKDVTNFYEIMPAENLETAFWLESDRMAGLSFDNEALEVQRRVVIEEFKETCLNQPYGDSWHHLMQLAYQKHPYQWPTIGKDISHIEAVTMEDVKSFFYERYRPNNAILVVAGNTDLETVRALAEKWFGGIDAGNVPRRALPQEEEQTEFRFKEQVADVPLDMFYLAFHIPDRRHPDYYKVDLLSDTLSNGASSRLYRRLLKEQKLFSDIDCYITNSFDPGLLIIEGKPAHGIAIETAEAAVWKELRTLQEELISETELRKLKNKLESLLMFSEASIMTKASNLAFYELMGNADLINHEITKYESVTVEDIRAMAIQTFRKENCSELRYKPSGRSSAQDAAPRSIIE